MGWERGPKALHSAEFTFEFLRADQAILPSDDGFAVHESESKLAFLLTIVIGREWELRHGLRSVVSVDDRAHSGLFGIGTLSFRPSDRPRLPT